MTYKLRDDIGLNLATICSDNIPRIGELVSMFNVTKEPYGIISHYRVLEVEHMIVENNVEIIVHLETLAHPEMYEDINEDEEIVEEE